MDCVLCSDELSPVLADGMLWRLVLNRNQNLIGKCMLVTRRHVEAVDQLTAAEWEELRLQLGRVPLRRGNKRGRRLTVSKVNALPPFCGPPW